MEFFQLTPEELQQLSNEHQDIVSKLMADVSMVAKGGSPQYCGYSTETSEDGKTLYNEPCAVASDGGSRHYPGKDYSITLWNHLTTFLGVDGLMKGFTVVLNEEVFGVPLSFGQTYFVSHDAEYKQTYGGKG